MSRFVYLLMVIAFSSCSKDNHDNTALSGKWVRVEQYVNPGNGGFWQQATDDPKVLLELTEDGKVHSNHNLYSTFTSYQKLGRDSIAFTNAAGQTRHHSYSIESGTLTIRFACREGCGDRFIRE